MADDKEQPGETSCSSSSSRRARQMNRSTLSNPGDWDCSVCTYKNTADDFKCFMCDVRKGTSTRKPRINTDNVVAQVVRQQEQIRQQAIKLAKPTSYEEDDDDDDDGENKIELSDDSSSASSSSTTSISSSSTSISSPRSSSSSSSLSSSSSSSLSSSSSSTTTSISQNSPPRTDSTPSPPQEPKPQQKPTSPLQHSLPPASTLGNKVFTYQPPVSHGKAGILIDRKKTTTSAITVNNITVTITEYATRKRSIAKRNLDTRHVPDKTKSSTKSKDKSTVSRQSRCSEQNNSGTAKSSSQSKANNEGTVVSEKITELKSNNDESSSNNKESVPLMTNTIAMANPGDDSENKMGVSDNSSQSSILVKEESIDTHSDENNQLPPLDPKKALYATMKI